MLLNKQTEMQEKVKNDLTASIDKVQNSIDTLETKIAKEVKETPLSVDKMIRNGIKDSWGTKDHTFIMNAIHQPTNFTDGDAPVVLPFREAGIDKLLARPTMVSQLVQWGTTSSNMIDWIERTDKTNSAGMRAENATMAEGDLEYTEQSTKVKILSEYMKATNESIKDVGFLAGEIKSELLEDLQMLLDAQLLSGDGTGNNLLGIVPQATTYAAGSFADSVTKPNEADVMRTALNQIFVAGKGRFFPSAVLMHPTDVAKLDLLKIADGRYIEIPYYDGDKMVVARVPIIQNVGMTEGDFLMGDFSRAKAFVRDSLAVRVFEQNENDVLFNRSTITANMRVAFRIKTNDKLAFVIGDFATAIAALDDA